MVSSKKASFAHCFGGQNIENRQGKDLGGVQGYLESIFGDPSVTKIEGKT